MEKRHGIGIPALIRAAVLVLFCLCGALVWPVDVLELRQTLASGGEGALLYSAPVPLGHELRTRMIHSVQLTPVEDIYRIQESRIWNWRERVMSHNAGLPSLPPARGRFLSEPPWMVFEGGGASWSSLYYRVGDKNHGRNACLFPSGRELSLWRDTPGERLLFRVVRFPLYCAL